MKELAEDTEDEIRSGSLDEEHLEDGEDADIQTGDLDMRTTAITIFNDTTTDLPAKDGVKEEESSVCSCCVNSLKKNSMIGEHQGRKRQGLVIENSQN